eukprot:scpid111631/ scgid1421/ 
MTICVALYSTTFMWPGDGQVQRAVVMADQQPVLLFSTRLLLDKMQQDNGGSSDGDSALLPIAKVYSMKVVLDTDSALVSDIFRTHGFEEVSRGVACVLSGRAHPRISVCACARV